MIGYLDEYIYVSENKSLNLIMISSVQKKVYLHHFYKQTLIYGQILSLENLLSMSRVTNSPMYGADWGSEDLFQRTFGTKGPFGQRTFSKGLSKPKDLWGKGPFLQGTFCQKDLFSKGPFFQRTFCQKDLLSKIVIG